MKHLFLVAVMLGVLTAVEAQARLIVPPRPDSFADFLSSGQDLVVEGTVLSAAEVNRRDEESCGTTGLMPLDITEVTLRVDRIFAGVCPDTVVAISALDHGYFPRGQAVGTRVIAWGLRSCNDGWRLDGRLGVIRADGTIVGPRGTPVRRNDDETPELVTVANLEAQAAKFETHPATAYNGTLAIALARRIDHNDWSSDGCTFQLDSLSWVIGRGPRMPRTMKFALLPGCHPRIFPGDSLLVPVPATFVGDTLFLDRCPSALRVQCGFVPGLGVYIDDLEKALVRVGSTFRLRPALKGGQ